MKIIPLISEEKIKERIEELAREISKEYEGKRLMVIGVLKGSFVFMADLIRRLTIPCRCDFVKLSSYGTGMESKGEVRMELDLSQDIRDMDILIVEDIVDTGLTLNRLREVISRHEPRGIKVCALLDKPSRRRVDVVIDYVGFEIEDRFVVGYGLDLDERYRYLPFIGFLEK